MPRRGGRRKKTRTQPSDAHSGKAGAVLAAAKLESSTRKSPAQRAKQEEASNAPPRSMIVRRGQTSKAVAELTAELRKVMAPHTAEKLREKPSNTLKDFVHASTPLSVTHLVMLTQRDEHVNMRVARVPAGPTLSFKIDSFVLMKNVRALQRRPFDTVAAYATAPLIVMNNFGNAEAPHVKLARITFEAMFAPIDVTTVKLTDCRRVVLLQRREDDSIELRHYAVRANAAGVTKSIKRVVEAKKIPDLSNVKDVADYVKSVTDYGSDSEAEEEDAEVVLPGKFVGRGNVAKATSAIKLAELGPRITMRLFKVQKGVCDGDVLYHAFKDDTKEEDDDEEEEDEEEEEDDQKKKKKKRREASANNKPRKKRRT